MKKHTIDPIRKYIRENEDHLLREVCRDLHPADLVDVMEQASTDEMILLLSRLKPEYSARVLYHVTPEYQVQLASGLSDEILSGIVHEMPADDRVDLLQRIPGGRKNRILHMLAKAEREDILKLESYDEGTAGAIMTSDYAILPADITTPKAIEKLRLEAPDKETIYYAYVIDEDRRLLGSVSLRELILASPETTAGELMHPDPVFVKVEDDQEAAARKIQKYDLLAIPVTNGNDAMVGIITHDDVHDVVEAETT